MVLNGSVFSYHIGQNILAILTRFFSAQQTQEAFWSTAVEW